MKAGVVEFLLARFAEDEVVAKAAREHEYLSGARDASPLRWARDPLGYGAIWVNSGRVLAEVEAKRRIVRALAADEGSGDTSQEGRAAHVTKLQVCLILAVPYADHPDYQQEWRP